MVNALKLFSLFLELTARFNDAASRVRETFARAKAEGRDVSDEELLQFRQESRDALNEWLDG